MLHFGTSICSLCKLRIRLVKLNRWVLQWPSQEFYFGVAWSFKNRQGVGINEWIESYACLTWNCDDLWVKCSFFSPKSKYAFWGEERPLSKFCGIYPFTSTRESSTAYLSCRGGVEHGPCTAQADRQRDPERLPLAKQELRGCRMCRLQVVTCCTG